jgi:transcriptional regulator with XRE-family HTH domain
LTVDWIRAGLKHTGKTRSGLAKALGRSPSAVTDLLNGHRRLRADEISIVAEYLGVEPPRLLGGGGKPITQRAPLIGYIGAGAVAHFYAEGQGPFDEVDAPSDAGPQTVALQIRGHSLGALFDNWLVLYDDVRDPPYDGQIGRMCVCGVSDGRALIKGLKKSPATGLWNLLSNTEPPIYDIGLDWAAPVRELRPR